ncbi:MAG: hypothetical protein JNK02_17895 [Planctomycetes bacterium]|nr:hypothetical protein [Planctomycetota bacterium]
MRAPSSCVALVAFLAAACSPGAAPGSPGPTTGLPADSIVFAGDLALLGDPALFAAGSVTVGVALPGEDELVLARSWDLGDSAWRMDRDGRRLYFRLDARDVVRVRRPGNAAADIPPNMDLVARFDPDGNPATEEAGVVRTRVHSRTGARDLEVELALGAVVAAHDAPGR